MADDNIIPFAKPEKPAPHLAGEALCIGCRHTWAAVAPVGTSRLECPACGLGKGMFRYPIYCEDGDSLFTCNCGCEALIAYVREGRFRIQCMNCGTHQTEAIFG